jgi:hypothetical protein
MLLPRPIYRIATSSAFSVRHRITRLLWSKPFSIHAGDIDQVEGRSGFGRAATMSNPTQTLTGDTALRSPIKPSGTAIGDARVFNHWRRNKRLVECFRSVLFAAVGKVDSRLASRPRLVGVLLRNCRPLFVRGGAERAPLAHACAHYDTGTGGAISVASRRPHYGNTRGRGALGDSLDRVHTEGRDNRVGGRTND